MTAEIMYCALELSYNVQLVTSIYFTAQCHTAAALSSQVLSQCRWWKQKQCPTLLQQGHPTPTEALCRVTSGTWLACTFLELVEMPAIPRQHKGVTPVSSSTIYQGLYHSLTFEFEVVIMEAQGNLSRKMNNSYKSFGFFLFFFYKFWS